jgi:hypothetical protein
MKLGIIMVYWLSFASTLSPKRRNSMWRCNSLLVFFQTTSDFSPCSSQTRSTPSGNGRSFTISHFLHTDAMICSAFFLELVVIQSVLCEKRVHYCGTAKPPLSSTSGPSTGMDLPQKACLRYAPSTSQLLAVQPTSVWPSDSTISHAICYLQRSFIIDTSITEKLTSILRDDILR